MVLSNSRYGVMAGYLKMFSIAVTWPFSTLISLMSMLCFFEGHCKVTSSPSSEKATIKHSDKNTDTLQASE